MEAILRTLNGSLSHIGENVRLERLSYLSLEQLSKVECLARYAARSTKSGVFCELGVALGGTSIVIADVAAKADRRFYGFDVFGMIPAPNPEFDDERSLKRYEVIKSGNARGIKGDGYYGYMQDLRGEVSKHMTRYNHPVDDASVFLVEGDFRQTLPTIGSEPVAFGHIDADWYESVLFGLEHLATQVVRNGIIVVDDYSYYGGCRQAVDEFRGHHPEFAFLQRDAAILIRK